MSWGPGGRIRTSMALMAVSPLPVAAAKTDTHAAEAGWRNTSECTRLIRSTGRCLARALANATRGDGRGGEPGRAAEVRCGRTVGPLSYPKARLAAGLRRPGPRRLDSNQHLSNGQLAALPVELPRGRATECPAECDALQDALTDKSGSDHSGTASLACASVPEDTYSMWRGPSSQGGGARSVTSVGREWVRLWRPVPMLALVVTALDAWYGLSRRLNPRRA